jgi:hypothetical protein
MRREKVEEARRLVEQMIDRGDAPIGLVSVHTLLAEALAPEDGAGDEETMYLGADPPKFGIVRPPA